VRPAKKNELDKDCSPNTRLQLTVDGSTTPSQYVWSSGFHRYGSDRMELASTLTPGPCLEYRRLQIGAENSSFCGVKRRVAH